MRRPTRWPATCAVLDTAPSKNRHRARGSGVQGMGAPDEGGWSGKGWEAELSTPPSPGALAGPVSKPPAAPTPGP